MYAHYPIFCYLNLDRFISYIRIVCLVFIIAMFCSLSKFNANSVDPDQTLRIAASDLGLHYLPVSLYGTLGLYE